MLVATNFGLITLIANGYRALVYAIIGVVVVPLATDVVRVSVSPGHRFR